MRIIACILLQILLAGVTFGSMAKWADYWIRNENAFLSAAFGLTGLGCIIVAGAALSILTWIYIGRVTI